MGGDGGSGGDGGAGGDGGHGGGTVACVDNVCPCTEAGIRAAIAAGGAEPYTFECGDGMTVVTQAQIVIDNDVTLDGGGMLTIDGNDAHRVLFVPSGITAELRGITVTGGVAQPPISHVPSYEFEEGGGIYSKGTLTLDNCTVSGNHAEDFGGGFSTTGVLTLMNSIVSENTAGYGGGIWGFGTLVMTNSKVVDNRADHGGGIILCGRITMTRSAVSDNTAATTAGGISQSCDEGSLIMVDSTVSGNTAGDDGGGIQSDGALTLTNSTVSHNTSTVGNGGGIEHDGVLTLTNSTVSYNAAVGGGGIANYGVARLTSSTISGNVATGQIGGSAILKQLAGRVESSMATVIDGDCSVGDPSRPFPLTSHGYNIESPGDTCGFDQPTDRPKTTVARLNLGELANNGGPTMTHKPGDGGYWEGSEAINKIPADDCELETDQRGEPRPETGGDACDIGAFEVQPEDP
jgi:predicted outer membrane repeat protein